MNAKELKSYPFLEGVKNDANDMPTPATRQFCKLLEQINSINIYDYVEKGNILVAFKYGLLKKDFSTVTQPCEITHDFS